MIADKTKKRNGLNFFRREDMIDYFRKLPLVNEIESRYLTVNEPIAIMTHDDSFDMEFETYEQKHGYTSTTFIFQHKITDAGKSAKTDMQIHYSKFSHLTLHEQIQKFKEKLNKNPTINRTHRLWWRESHLDLANLAMHGIQVDSTLIGYRPFRLVAQQRLLPIWEVPFSVVDAGAISVTNSATCTYNIADNMETLFQKNVTPIVGLFHPYLKARSKWKDFFAYADAYHYKIMNLTDFKNKYLE